LRVFVVEWAVPDHIIPDVIAAAALHKAFASPMAIIKGTFFVLVG
jgi:hypothetical protein